MSAVWYTADTHFMHKMLALDIRGFSSVEEHDSALIDNWNSCVGPKDTVWHLGDFSLKQPYDFSGTFRKLNGTIHLISGNHDRCFSGIRDSYKWQQAYYNAGFASVQSFARKKLDGMYIMLSHFPYSGDHGPDRYTQYRLKNEGLPILHGHTHFKERSSWAVLTPQLHVGMDAWHLKPVHQEVVIELLRAMIEEGPDDGEIADS